MFNFYTKKRRWLQSSRAATMPLVGSSLCCSSDAGDTLEVPSMFNSIPAAARRWSFLLVALFLLVCGQVHAQVSVYAFSQATATYTPVSGGTNLGSDANDDNNFNDLPLGFMFIYNGLPYTRFSVNANGFIAMGSSVANSYSSLSTGTSNNVIAAFNRDIQSNTGGNLQYITTGTAPNRVLTIQWTNFRNYLGIGHNYNFQIRLFEGSNAIRFCYGTMVTNATSPVAVGLRGGVNSDFNNRTSTTSWTATTAGGTNAATVTTTAAIFPPTGLEFNFTPSASGTVYYSKAASTNFADPASWGANSDGTGSSPGSVSTADVFIISNNSAMVLNASAGARNLYIESGSLTISSNTLTVGQAASRNNVLGLAGGTLTVSGGTLNINGSFALTSNAAALAQSNGNINVDGNNAGTAATSVPVGVPHVFFGSSNINLTGGILTILDPHASVVASDAFAFSSGTDVNSSASHTFRLGDGASNDAGGTTSGFRIHPAVGAGRFLFGNLTVNVLTGTNRFVATSVASTIYGIRGNLTITSGEFRISSNPVYLAGNLVNNGTLTTTGTLYLGNFVSQAPSPALTAQNISGTGLFRNSTTASTANFAGLSTNNTSAGGITFASTAVTPTLPSTGTVSGTLTMVNGTVNSTSPFILGISTTSTGILSATPPTNNGGFGSGTTFRRWIGNATIPAAPLVSSPTAVPFFPFVVSGASRRVYLARSAALTTPGTIQCTHNEVAGLVADGFNDAGYIANSRSNANWTFAVNGVTVTTQTFTLALAGEGTMVLLNSPNNAPRLMQVGAAAGTHSAGTGTTSNPIGNRTGLTLGNLTGSAHHLGVGTGDLGFYSVSSGSYNSGATWSTGNPPTATDNPVILAGHTVTVSAPSVANNLTVAGTLSVTGSTLNIGGAATTGLEINGTGVVNLSGGTINVGPQDNSFCNRTLLINGTLNVSSGTLNLAGNMLLNLSGFLTQSGGNINVDGNAAGSPGNSVLSTTDIVSFNGNFNSILNGGTFTIVDPHASTNASINAFSYTAGTGINVNTTSLHTFQFGNGVSTDAGGSVAGFRNNTWVGSGRFLFGNLTVNAGAGTNRFVTQAWSHGIANLTINSGSEYRTIVDTYISGNLVNNGTFVSTAVLYFGNFSSGTASAATVAQAVSGSGTFLNQVPPTAQTANLTSVTFRNTHPSGITLNVPLSLSGTLSMFTGVVNTSTGNELTHIKTGVAASLSVGSPAGYINGPVRVTFPASLTNATSFFPTGQTGPNYIAFFNVVTNAGGPVTIQATGDNTLNAPNGFDASLTSVNLNREWNTSIVSGAANLTSFSVQAFEGTVVSGDAMAKIKGLETEFSVLGSGSTWVAAGLLPASLALNLPPILTADFPDRITVGTTGPLAVTSASADHPLTSEVTPGSVDQVLLRVNIPALGSSGSLSLSSVKFTYTGSNGADIAASGVKLWNGTFFAPGSVIGTVSVVSNEADFTSLTQTLNSGSNWFWLTCNIASGATLGNIVDFTIQAGDMSFAVSGGASAAATVPVAVLNPLNSRTIGYCVPTYTTGCGAGEEISLVNLAGNTITLNQSSACTPLTFYTFYSAANKPDIEQGSTYNLAVTMGSDGTQFSGVWIDFNQNGVFETTEYFSTGSNAGSGGTSNISIVVPGTATLGFTRMRVRGGNDAALTSSQACGASSSSFGETEDYIVNIVSPSPAALGTIAAVHTVTSGLGVATTNNDMMRVNIPTSGSLGGYTLNSIKFTYTGTSASDIASGGVSLWAGNISGPVSQIGTSQSISGGFVNFTGLSRVLGPGDNYFWLRVNTSASAVIGRIVDFTIVSGDISIANTAPSGSAGSQPTALIDPSGSRFIDYCAAGTTSGGSIDLVSNVVLVGNTITLSQASGLAAIPYYTFYNAASKPDLFRGATYNVNISMGTDANQYSAVWLDFDNDGLFETTEYFSLGSSAGASGTSVIPVAIPSGASLGDIRMRVRGGSDGAYSSSDACGILSGTSTTQWGEAEDYIVSIVLPPNCSTVLPLAANTTTASTTTVCTGGSITFNLSSPLPVAAGFSYQLRRNGSNVGSPVFDLPINVVPTSGGNYDVQVLCNSSVVLTAAPVSIVVNAPTVTPGAGPTRCGSGTVNLTATFGGGATAVRWFSAATGGIPVGTGSPFTTPELSASTTYYAEASVVGTPTNGAKLAPTLTTSTTGTDWGLVFDASQAFTLNSVDVYPVGTAGSITIQVQNSSGVAIPGLSGTYAFPGTTGAPHTISLGFDIPVGIGYRLIATSITGGNLIRENSGNIFPYSLGSVGAVTGGYIFGPSASYYWFYNWSVSTICNSPRSAVAVTINTPPVIVIAASSTNICEGENVSVLAQSALPTYVYTWSGGSFSPSGPGASKTLTPATSATYTVSAVGGGCNNSASVTIRVRPTPTVPVVTQVVPGAICFNTSKSFTSSSTSQNDVLFAEDFNSGTLASRGWTFASTGTPLAPANRWFLQSTPYSYAPLTQIDNFSITSPASPFVVINSDIFGSGTSGTSQLISPSFSTLGETSATLTFKHVYRTVGSPNVGRVDYSVDGGITWTTNIFSVSSNTPTGNNYPTNIAIATASVVLPPAALNQSNVRIRFHYGYSYDYYWMIDDIQITSPETVSYLWASPSPFAGIPPLAQSFATANNNVTVTPTDGGSYSYTARATNTSGCSSAVSTPSSFDVSRVVLAVSNTGPQRSGTNLQLSSNVTGTFGGLVYAWRKTAGFGSDLSVINSNPLFSYPSANTNNSGTYQLTVTDANGCVGTASTDALVYESLVWNGSVSNDWNTAANWTPQLVPKAPTQCETDPLLIDNITITNSGTPPTYPGSGVFVNNFGVESGLLTLTNNVKVCNALGGASAGVGKVVGAGSIELVGGAPSFVGGILELDRLIVNKSTGGSVSFQGKLRINESMSVLAAPAGITVQSSGEVILASTMSQTARINAIPSGTSISVVAPGGFVMERAVDFASPSTVGKWAFLGSTMTGKFFGDWADDFRIYGPLSGFGSQGNGVILNENDRCTIFRYNEPENNATLDTVRRRGWRWPTSLETITPGRGYRVWIDQYTMGPIQEIDNKGMFTFGDFVFPTLTRTENVTCNNFTSASNAIPCTDAWWGWNLLANPYPAPLDWDAGSGAWVKPGIMNNAFFTWVSNTGSYRAYVGAGGSALGQTTVSGSPFNLIPSSQAFFVKLNSESAGVTLSVKESAKATGAASGNFVRQAVADNQVKFRLKPASSASYQYDIMLKLSEGATNGYDANQDLEALAGQNAEFALVNDNNEQMLLNAIPVPTESKVIPMVMKYNGIHGSYSISFLEASSVSNATVYLRDNYLSTLTNVASQPSYEFAVSSIDGSAAADRFELVVSPNAVTSTSRLLNPVFGIYPNPSAGSAVTLSVGGISSGDGKILVTDMTGKLVFNGEMVISAGKLNEKVVDMGLPSGVYTVKLVTNTRTFIDKLVIR